MIKKRGSIIFLITFLSLFLVGMGSAFAAAPIVIKYAHGDPPDPIKGSAHADAVIFKHYVESRSGGRIKVEIYPACQLGSEREMLEGVKMGTIEVTNVSEGTIPSFFPEILATAIPYLFRSEHVAYKVLDGPYGKELMEEMRKKTGIRCLNINENGYRNFTNNIRPIRRPEDMKGIKFRTMEHPGHMKMVSALGSEPTPIAWGELYTALQQKIVDGQENPVSLIEVMKFYEVQKYLTLDGHIYSIDFTFINDDFYKRLPDDLKQVVYDSAQIAGLVHRGMQVYTSATGVERLKKHGMEVYTPTLEELLAFRAKCQQPVIDWIKTKIDPKWVDKLLKAVEEAEKELAAPK